MKQIGEFPEVMDVRTCARYLHISSDTLYSYASRGFVPGFKLGNRWRFKKDMIDVWIESQIQEKTERSRMTEPTAEQTKRLDFAFMAISKARRKARTTLGTGKPGTCSMWCPICIRGTIFITVENQKISGECSTENCVRWSNM
jgi:excisionase family DNA binding protein